MKSSKAEVYTVGDLVQDLEADTEPRNVREGTPAILYGEESTELTHFKALLVDDSEHVGRAGTHFNDAVDAVDYKIHLTQFQFCVNCHHWLDGEQHSRLSGRA